MEFQLQILKDAVKVLQSICQQIWKTQQCPQDWKRSVFIPIPKKWKWSEVKLLSGVWLFATPWTAVYQAHPSTGFSRQECWSGLLFPSLGNLPDPGIKPGSPALQADALPSEPPGKPIPKKGSAKECSNYLTIALISHANKVLLIILQIRLQQCVNREIPNVQAGFRTDRGTRDQIANIHWIIEKARKFQKKCLLNWLW